VTSFFPAITANPIRGLIRAPTRTQVPAVEG